MATCWLALTLCLSSLPGRASPSTPHHKNGRSSRKTVVSVQANKVSKIDIKKQGMGSMEEGNIKQNLQGTSRFMSKKGWKDPQGRVGKASSNKAGQLAPGTECLPGPWSFLHRVKSPGVHWVVKPGPD